MIKDDNLSLVQRRISQTSADELLVRSLIKLRDLLRSCNCGFLFLGSCALQTYLPRPNRLPNDIDVVLPEGKEGIWINTCVSAGIEVIVKPARMLIAIDGTPIHVLFGGISQVDLELNRVFDFLSIDFKSTILEREFWLLAGRHRVSIPVPRPEILFATTLIRPINSNSFLDCQALMEACDLSASEVAEFCGQSRGVHAIVAARLAELSLYLTEHNQMLVARYAALLKGF